MKKNRISSFFSADYRVPIGIGVFLILIVGIILQKDIIVHIGAVCVSIFMVWAMLYSSINRRIMLQHRCTQTMMAKCIGMQSQHDRDGELYAPVYEIQYKGETLTLVSDIYCDYRDIQAGQMREIKIDPQDPHYFIEVKRKIMSLPAKIIVAVFFIIWSICWLQDIF